MKLQHAFNEAQRSFTGALFSTYVFNSDYFEGTLLPILGRKSVVGETVVCLDTGSYEETLSNEEARPSKVGSDYYLSPMRVANGRYHPKVYLFGGEQRVIGFVASANLTGAAFDQNQEVVLQFDLQRSAEDPEASDIHGIAGICRYYEELLAHPISEAMGATARNHAERIITACNWVDDLEPAPTTETSTTVLSNLSGSMIDQVTTRIAGRDEELQHVDIIAPFYGTGLAVPERFTNQGVSTTLWLQQDNTQIDTEALHQWVDEQTTADTVVFDTDRYVHGKVLLLQTTEAVYCLSGSPNASRAALLESVGSGQPYANVEVGVLRREPDPDYYSYLLDPLKEGAIQAELINFRANSTPDYRPPESPADQSIALLEIDYTESEVFDGGRLRGQLRIPGGVSDADTLKLRIAPRTADDYLELTWTGGQLTSVNDGPAETFSLSRRLTDQDKFSTPATVTPIWNGEAGTQRWLAMELRTVDREAGAAADNDGVDAVWRTIADVYFGDAETREQGTAFLGALATAISSDNSGTETGGRQQGGGGLSEGITLPSYSGSTSSTDPSKHLEGFYETWTEQLRTLRNELLKPGVNSERILSFTGERLSEFNRTNTWLGLIDRELQHRSEDIESFPDDLPRSSTRELYSRTEQGFGNENTSVVAQFVSDAQGTLATEAELTALQHHIGGNILFGQLVAETFFIDQGDSLSTYYGDAFSTLLEECVQDHSGDAQLNELVNELTDSLWAHFGELPSSFEAASLSRQPPRQFTNKDATRRFVRERLQPS